MRLLNRLVVWMAEGPIMPKTRAMFLGLGLGVWAWLFFTAAETGVWNRAEAYYAERSAWCVRQQADMIRRIHSVRLKETN